MRDRVVHTPEVFTMWTFTANTFRLLTCGQPQVLRCPQRGSTLKAPSPPASQPGRTGNPWKGEARWRRAQSSQESQAKTQPLSAELPKENERRSCPCAQGLPRGWREAPAVTCPPCPQLSPTVLWDSPFRQWGFRLPTEALAKVRLS